MDSPNSARFHFVESGRHPDDNAGRGTAVHRSTRGYEQEKESTLHYELSR
jgi:hypothetical protein